MSTQRRQLIVSGSMPSCVAVQDVRLEHRREQVVRGADRVDVAGEVEVQVLHRDDLRVAAAGRAALDPEDRAERRLAQAEHRALADRAEALREADRGGRLALAGLRRRDRGDADQLRVGPVARAGRARTGRPSPCSGRRARPRRRSSPISSASLGDRPQCRLLGDLEAGGHLGRGHLPSQAYPREDGVMGEHQRRSRRRRHLHRPRRGRRRRARHRQGAVRSRRGGAGNRGGAGRGGRGGGGGGRARARDDRGDERVAGAPRRAHGARHDRGLPRRDRDRPAEPGLALRPDCARPGSARAARAAVHRARADGAGGRGRAARRRSRCGRRSRPSRGGGRGGRGLPALRVPAPGARAARWARRCASRCRRVRVSLSSELLPEFREYERCSTTVANAYLAPALSAYLDEDRAAAARHAVLGRRGRCRPRRPPRPAACVLPGPAAGVVGAAFVAGAGGFEDVLTFDMGGTSTDVAAVLGGEAQVTAESVVAGVPIRLPDGRRAHDRRRRRLDRLAGRRRRAAGRAAVGGRRARPGVLRPGRHGADRDRREPRPRLPGRRGRPRRRGRSTRPERWRDESSRRSPRLETGWNATSSDRSEATEAAAGVVRVVEAEMARALRVVSVERGIDPRGLALVAFGGAGPLHACALAEELGIERVLVPFASGMLSALGLAAADLRRDYVGGPFEEMEARAARGPSRGAAIAAARRRALPRPVARADRRGRRLGRASAPRRTSGATDSGRTPSPRSSRGGWWRPPARAPFLRGAPTVDTTLRPPRVPRRRLARPPRPRPRRGRRGPGDRRAARLDLSRPARLGRASPTTPAPSSWSERGPGDPLGDERRARRDRRGDGHRRSSAARPPRTSRSAATARPRSSTRPAGWSPRPSTSRSISARCPSRSRP